MIEKQSDDSWLNLKIPCCISVPLWPGLPQHPFQQIYCGLTIWCIHGFGQCTTPKLSSSLCRAVSCHLEAPRGTTVTTGAVMETLQRFPVHIMQPPQQHVSKTHRPPGQVQPANISPQKTLQAAFCQARATCSCEAPSVCLPSLPGGTLQYKTAHIHTIHNQMVQPLS